MQSAQRAARLSTCQRGQASMRALHSAPKRCSRQPVAASAEPTTTEGSAAPLSRRQASLVGLASAALLLGAAPVALAAENDAVKRGLSTYIKKKRLERLDTYVPPLLEAKAQLVRTGRVMLQSPKEARQLLRSGAFSGLRDNVRALGEYAAQRAAAGAAAPTGPTGQELVQGFFKSLESFDYALLAADRAGSTAGDAERRLLDETVAALDRLLATVPEADMQRARDVVTALEQGPALEEALVDPEQLEKLRQLL